MENVQKCDKLVAKCVKPDIDINEKVKRDNSEHGG
jgi:hypothetical protein